MLIVFDISPSCFCLHSDTYIIASSSCFCLHSDTYIIASSSCFCLHSDTYIIAPSSCFCLHSDTYIIASSSCFCLHSDTYIIAPSSAALQNINGTLGATAKRFTLPLWQQKLWVVSPTLISWTWILQSAAPETNIESLELGKN
jgi:hypothetical protein